MATRGQNSGQPTWAVYLDGLVEEHGSLAAISERLAAIGGWRDDTLYQPQPYNGNTVREVIIGFQSGDTVRTWNGVAVPW